MIKYNLECSCGETFESWFQNSNEYEKLLKRNAKSFLFAIVGAEYILNWLPKGTHDWNKFLRPNEIISTASNYQLVLKETVGFKFNIFLREWQKSKDTNVNYAVSFKKN